MAQAITMMPPLKSTIKPIFFRGLIVAPQSIGSGIESRYRSVATLQDKNSQIIRLDIAGWQSSVS